MPCIKFIPALLTAFLLFTSCNGQRKVKADAFAGKLLSHKICSDKNYQQLLTDFNAGKLNDPVDFLKYCDKAVIIETKKFSADPDTYFEQIHLVTAKLLPELAFTNFKYQIVSDTQVFDPEFKSYDLVVSLECNEKMYSHSSYHHMHRITEKPDTGVKIDQQEYYKIFNRILADRQSPYRLHEVKSYTGDAESRDRFGIIALTKEQAKMLHGGGAYFMVSYEKFKNALTTARIDSAVAAYQELGLLSHLSKEEIKAGKVKIAAQENRNLNEVLACFPRTLYWFDAELSNLKDPYRELLQELSGISKDAFKPTGITDNFVKPEKNAALVSFVINGKEYAQKLVVDNDWLDPEFFSLVDKAVEENHLNGRFCQLYTGGQDAIVIYLTPGQEKSLRAKNLLVFDDQWEVEEE